MAHDDDTRAMINGSHPEEHAIAREVLGLDWYDVESQARRVIMHFAKLQANAQAAIDRAWHLGQTYCHQADHEFISQQRKSDETLAKFKALKAEFEQ